jgi:hypothetical protein
MINHERDKSGPYRKRIFLISILKFSYDHLIFSRYSIKQVKIEGME